MELSRQGYKYLCFEILRLRTIFDNEKDEKVKVRIAKRYGKVVTEFNKRSSNWFWTEHELDRIIKAVEELKAEDWCASAGGQWITSEGKHICVGIKDFDKVPEQFRERAREWSTRETGKPLEESFTEVYNEHTGKYLRNNVPIEKMTREEFYRTTGISPPKDSNVFYSLGRRKIFLLEGAKATPELLHHEGHHAIWFSRVTGIPGWKDDSNFETEIKGFKKATRDEGPVTFYAANYQFSQDKHTYYAENFAEAGALYYLGDEAKEKLKSYPKTYKAYMDFMDKFEKDEERRTS